MGENRTFVGGEDYLRARGVDVINLDSQECVDLMNEFIAAHPEIWYEDIGGPRDAWAPIAGQALGLTSRQVLPREDSVPDRTERQDATVTTMIRIAEQMAAQTKLIARRDVVEVGDVELTDQEVGALTEALLHIDQAAKDLHRLLRAG